MKKSILLTTALLLPVLGTAKELPAIDVMLERLNQSGLASADKWEDKGASKMQAVDAGILFVAQDNVSGMMAITGTGETEVMLSYSLASLQCANTALTAIDMNHNDSLRESLVKSSIEAIGAHEQKSNTMAWGYKYETSLTQTKLGLLMSCKLY